MIQGFLCTSANFVKVNYHFLKDAGPGKRGILPSVIELNIGASHVKNLRFYQQVDRG